MRDFMAEAEEFVDWLISHPKCKGVRAGDRIDSRCPLPEHEDLEPSFSFYPRNNGWKCSCGHGRASELWQRLGWSPSGIRTKDNAPISSGTVKPKSRIVAQYEYQDELGVPLYRVLRLEPKSFRQEAWLNGRWTGEKGVMAGVRRVPYRLPMLLNVERTDRILIVDGEKDVEAAWRLGYPATCCVAGMQNWTEEAMKFLPDCEYTVVADKDGGAGKKGAQKVLDLLVSVRGIKPKIVEMPGAGVKDLADWVQAGGTLEQLQGIAEARETWEKVTRSPIVPMSDLKHLLEIQIEYLIYPIIPKNSLALIQGAPKSGKSAYALFLALNACAGSWHEDGQRYIIERPIRTLLVEYEDAEILVAQRCSKYLGGMGQPRNFLPENLFLCSYPDLYLDSPRYCDALISAVKDLKIDLVIIDTLSYVHQASDENSAGEMKPLMANFKRIARENGFSILLIHHTGKGSKDKTLSDRGRGSTVIGAAPDVIMDWGTREDGTHVTPVNVLSKYDQPHSSFDVHYLAQPDGSVIWKHHTKERTVTDVDLMGQKETEDNRLISDIQKRTRITGGAFSMDQFYNESASWLGYNAYCRCLKRLENQRLVSIKGFGSRREIMAINMEAVNGV